MKVLQSNVVPPIIVLESKTASFLGPVSERVGLYDSLKPGLEYLFALSKTYIEKTAFFYLRRLLAIGKTDRPFISLDIWCIFFILYVVQDVTERPTNWNDLKFHNARFDFME